MSVSDVDSMAETYRLAGEYFLAGELVPALDLYLDLARRRLERRCDTGRPWVEADLQIFEQLAQVSLLLGRFEPAELLLGAGSDICHQMGDTFGRYWLATQRAHVLLGQGRLGAASDNLQSTLGAVGIDAAAVARPERVRADEARLTWPTTDEGNRRLLVTSIYWALGRLQASEGRYDRALGFFRNGLRQTTSGTPQPIRMLAEQLALAIAGALLEKGELAAAEEHLSQPSPSDPRAVPEVVLRRHELLGQLALLRGDLNGAMEQTRTARELCSRLALGPAMWAVELHRAHLLLRLNRTVEVEHIASRIEREATIRGDDTAVARARWLIDLSRRRRRHFDRRAVPPPVYELQNRVPRWRPEPAETIPSHPRDVPRPGNFLAFYEESELAARWYLGRPSLDRQLLAWLDQHLSNLEEVFAGTDSTLVALRLDVLRATLEIEQGKLHSARARLADRAEQLRALGMRAELFEAQRLLGECATRLDDHDRAREHDLEAAELLDGLTAAVPSTSRGLYLGNKWSTAEKRLAAELDELEALQQRSREGPWYRRLHRRWRLRLRLDAILDECDGVRRRAVASALGDLGEPEPEQSMDAAPEGRRRLVSLLRRLFRHPFRRATLVVLSLPDRTVVVGSMWGALWLEVRSLSRINLRHWVSSWHQTVEQRAGARNLSKVAGDSTASDRSWWGIAGEVSAALRLPEILDALPPWINALTIVPDDVLHGFPFAVVPLDVVEVCRQSVFQCIASPWSIASTIAPGSLCGGWLSLARGVDDGGRGKGARRSGPGQDVLGIRFRLTVGQRSTRPPRRRRRIQQALLVGVGLEAVEVKGLEGAVPEVRVLETWFDSVGLGAGVECLVDAAARRTTLLDQLPEQDLWHIACHGSFAPDDPAATGLVLVTESAEIELLSLRDLAGLDLENLEHVTLSSCWGADNYVLPGRLVLSLPEVLCRRGAGSVLASLWALDDGIMPALTRELYALLATHARDEALRRFRAACLDNKFQEGDGIETSSPYCWAGFQLYGDPRRLRLGSQRTSEDRKMRREPWPEER